MFQGPIGSDIEYPFPTVAVIETAAPSVSQSPLPSETPISEPESTQSKGIPAEYLSFGAAIIVVAVLVIGVFIYKKRKS